MILIKRSSYTCIIILLFILISMFSNISLSETLETWDEDWSYVQEITVPIDTSTEIELQNTFNMSKSFIVGRYASAYNDDTNRDADLYTSEVSFVNESYISIEKYSAGLSNHSYYVVQSDNIQVWNGTTSFSTGASGAGVDKFNETLSPALPSDY